MGFKDSYQIYAFILSCITLAVFIVVFAFMLAYITRLSLIIVRGGLQDKELLKKYANTAKKKKCGAGEWLAGILFCTLAVGGVIFSFVLQANESKAVGEVPALRVVYSNSMACKNEGNEYLFEKDLNGQFRKFDLILTRKLPTENELQLYDIVVYEIDGSLIVHRIVGIEEPNGYHENRLFFLQGDAVESRDKAPVSYAQMRAIYRGEKIPFLGSLVLFLQSTAGLVCVLALVLGSIAVAILKCKVEKAERKRIKALSKRQVASNGASVGAESVCAVPSAIVFYPVFYRADCSASFQNFGKRK